MACALNMGGILHGLLVALGRRAGLGLRRRRLRVGLGAGRAVLRPAHDAASLGSSWPLASAAAVSPAVEVGLAAVGGVVSPLGGASVAMTARQASYTPRAAQLASVAGAGRVQLSD